MSEVKWVKLSTDIFKNQKIEYILSLPKGAEMFTAWIYLLTLAGQVNDGGKIYVTEDIVYTPAAFARAIGISLATMKKALSTYESLDMITAQDGIYIIKNWEKYQNADALDALREYRREAKKKSRASQTNVNDMSNECQTDVKQMSLTFKEKETESEKEKRTKREKEKEKVKEIKIIEGGEGETRAGALYTPPTKNEIAAYIIEKGYKTMTAERFISYYANKKIPIPSAWRETLDSWEKNDVNNGAKKEHQGSFDTEDFFLAALKKTYGVTT